MGETFWDKVENLFAGKYDRQPTKGGAPKGRNIVDMLGLEFDTWVVVDQAEVHPLRRTARWYLECKLCGAECEKDGVQLRKGVYGKCGCQRPEPKVAPPAARPPSATRAPVAAKVCACCGSLFRSEKRTKYCDDADCIAARKAP